MTASMTWPAQSTPEPYSHSVPGSNSSGVRNDALVAVAGAHRAEPATVALAWLLAKGATAPIASASAPEQVPALVAAPGLELTADEVAALDEASRP